MSRLLLSCSDGDQAEERRWAVQLLVAGMQSPLDGQICRSVEISLIRTSSLRDLHQF